MVFFFSGVNGNIYTTLSRMLSHNSDLIGKISQHLSLEDALSLHRAFPGGGVLRAHQFDLKKISNHLSPKEAKHLLSNPQINQDDLLNSAIRCNWVPVIEKLLNKPEVIQEYGLSNLIYDFLFYRFRKYARSFLENNRIYKSSLFTLAALRDYPDIFGILLARAPIDDEIDRIYAKEAAVYLARHGRIELLQALIKEGRVSRYDLGGMVITSAARHGQIEVVKFLLALPDLYVSRDSLYFSNPITRAGVNGHHSIVRLLFKDGRYPLKSSSLIEVAQAGQVRSFRLLEQWPKVKIRKVLNRALLESARSGSIEMVRYLLNRAGVLGHRVWFTDCLMEAVSGGNYLVVQAFLDYSQTDPTFEDYYPIKLAIWNKDRDILRLLVRDHRVDPGLTEWISISSIYEIDPELSEEIITDPRFYNRIKGRTEVVNRENNDQVAIRLINHPRAEFTVSDLNHLLIDTIRSGKFNLVRYLVEEKGADPSFRNHEAITRVKCPMILDYLLQYDQVNPSAQGNQLLIRSCRWNLDRVVKRFLEDPRSDPTLKCQRALRIASVWGSVDVIKVLFQEGRVVPDIKTLLYAIDHPNASIIRAFLEHPKLNVSESHEQIVIRVIQTVNLEAVRAVLDDPRFDPFVQGGLAKNYLRTLPELEKPFPTFPDGRCRRYCASLLCGECRDRLRRQDPFYDYEIVCDCDGVYYSEREMERKILMYHEKANEFRQAENNILEYLKKHPKNS